MQLVIGPTNSLLVVDHAADKGSAFQTVYQAPLTFATSWNA
jgi:hypothetical protein